jgi:hypothetical protein
LVFNLLFAYNAGHEGRGSNKAETEKNDGYSRVPLDAFVVRLLF